MSLSRPHSLSLPSSLSPSLLFLPVFMYDHFNNYVSVVSVSVSVSVSVCVCILHTPFVPFSSRSFSSLPSLPFLLPSSVTSTGFLFQSSFSAPPSRKSMTVLSQTRVRRAARSLLRTQGASRRRVAAGARRRPAGARSRA